MIEFNIKVKISFLKMRVVCFIGLFVFTSFSSQAQIFWLEARNSESGYFDRVQFGFDENASIGIDELDGYNEENLFGIPPTGEAELRIYQRDQENFNCLFNKEEEIHFPVNFDSKDNIRNSKCPSNDCFIEIVIEKGYFNGFQLSPEGILNLDYSLTDFIEKIDFFDSCQHLVKTQSFNSEVEVDIYEWAIFQIDSMIPIDTVKSIVVEFKSNILTSGLELNIADLTFKVYPNPSSSLIYIDNLQNQFVGLELLDVDGRLIKEIHVPKEDKIEVDISGLEPAMYLLKLRTKDGLIYFEKVVKI